MYIHVNVQMHLERVHQAGLVHSQARQAQSLPSPHPPPPGILWLCEAEHCMWVAHPCRTARAQAGLQVFPMDEGRRLESSHRITKMYSNNGDHLLPRGGGRSPPAPGPADSVI